MTRFQKAALGFLSPLPLLYLLVLLMTPLKGLFREGFLENLTTGKLLFLFVHFLMFSLTVFLFVIFLVHLMSSTRPRAEKVLWIALFIALGPASLPLYWYFRIYRS
jgi:type IV secretory pathway TrbL component